LNLATIIDAHPSQAVALVSRRRETTYGELREQAARYRAGLAGLGLRPGDHVGIACANNWYFVVSYLAVLGAGMVAVPLNPLSPAPELTAELAAARVRALVVTPAAHDAVAAVDRAAVPDLDHLIVTRGTELPGAVHLDELLDGVPVTALTPAVDRDDDELAALMFTSGTMGAARAAMLTHGNLRSNLEQLQGHLGRRQEPTDVVFGVLPFFHIFGLNVVLGLTLYTGARVVLVERFDPQAGIDAVGRNAVTIVPGAPTMFAQWASQPGVPAEAFATVRIAASGGAPLPVEVAEAMEERFGLNLVEGYGLTEASPVVTTMGGSAAPRGSIGTPLPGVDVRLVDDDGEDVLAGDAGEVWVRGANVFPGYLDEPEATATALDGGWLHTGDIGVVDDDGFLYLVDRKKDLIIVSGFNVYPIEVEEVLAEHPAVAAVAVVGVPHPFTGEAVTAYVVPRPDRHVEEDEIIGWCSQRLARYKCPAKVLFVDDIPRGPAGKLLRRQLRAS
jgi:long-chain acyl-CoA synthetase